MKYFQMLKFYIRNPNYKFCHKRITLKSSKQRWFFYPNWQEIKLISNYSHLFDFYPKTAEN